jgi:iron complex outermembrane receptor protein
MGPSHSLWAAASRAVRTPSRFEQDVDVTLGAGPTTPLFLRLLGNPDYEAEVLHAYEAGYRTDLGHSVLFDLAAFHGRYQKLLGAVPGTVSQEPGRLVISVTTANALEASSWGAEASITAHPAPGWLLQGDYSYLSLALERSPGSDSFTSGLDEEGSSPRHQFHLRSALKLHRTVEVSAAFRWVDALAAQHVPAYSELDARLAWSPVSRVELGLAGRNLLKPRHPEFGGNRVEASQIERAVLALLRLNW